MYPELTEEERFPILSPRGREFLHRMRQHASAPMWNWPNGEQLHQNGLERVRQFQKALVSQETYSPHTPPGWLGDFIERCIEEVPFYRGRTPRGVSLEEIPTCSRSDLAPRVWDFVPDSESLEELVIFSSSGTTGQPTRTPHHPFSAACGIPLIEYALRELHGITMPRSVGQVAITNVAAYPGAFTTAIVVSYLEEAGCVRVNLDPSAWRTLSDREKYINEWQAPIWLGDPVAFGVLETLQIDYKPQAIVSSILHLTDTFAARLRTRYECPVVDLIAMTEAGIIAARTEQGYRVLPHDLHVEILDEHGNRCRPGVRGEITLTGGRNPFLPLLRYRTGDHAAMEFIAGHRVLIGFEGRQPVEYRASDGRMIHSMQLTQLMRRFPVHRYQMREAGNNAYELHIRGDVDRDTFQREISQLFGTAVQIRYDEFETPS
jgi:phenylacetate-CoA ligase